MATDVPAGKQRVVLAALLTHANSVVSCDQLVEYLWDNAPPARARVVLRNYVMRLRRALAPEAAARLVTQDPGYLLRAEESEADLLLFAARYRAGARAVAAGDWRRASGELHEALALWRGEPLADVPSESLRRDVLPGLAEQRLQAVEWRVTADLHLGRHEDLISELRGLTSAHPLRERFHAQLMVALARCGRQGEALAAYQRARSLLIDELGIEPGVDLRQVHQRLLRGEPPLPGPLDTEPGAGPGSGAGSGVGGSIGSGDRDGAARAGSTDRPGRSTHPTHPDHPDHPDRAGSPDGADGEVDAVEGREAVAADGAAPASGPTSPAAAARQPAEAAPVAAGAGPVVPRQLPGAVRHFVGRTNELEAMTGLLDGAAESGRMVIISTIAGTAGIGKTSLAVHWAHRVAERFPDGQLYVNFRGFEPRAAPVAPGEAMRGFLEALGVPGDRLPAQLEEQASLYRSLLAGKRVLIILDNARDVEQVRPLLPGSPSCVVVVTSRSQLIGLIAREGARLITLDLLRTEEARDILVYHLGLERVLAEAVAVNELIELCQRLPLALSIVAARAAAQPGLPLSALVAQLRKSPRRLDVLDTGDAATDVRAVISGSYRHLSPPAARLFRLLGLHPGSDISLRAAASLSGRPPDATQQELDELTQLHLLLEHSPGRFSMHDLLRTYAAEVVVEESDASERALAAGRLLDHYLHTALHAAQLLSPVDDPLPLRSPLAGAEPERFAEGQQAVAWFGAEHRVLLAVVSWAADSGYDTHAWQLPLVLVNSLTRCGHWHDAATTLRTALRAATRVGDEAALARASSELGRPLTRLGALDEAQRHLRQGLASLERLGDSGGQANALLGLSMVFERLGRPAEALDHCRRALQLHRSLGHRHGTARALNATGWFHILVGEHEQALRHAQEALRLYTELGNQAGEADAWHTLAHAHEHHREYRRALRCYQRACRLDHELGHRYDEAETLSRIGDIHRAIGDVEAARHAWQRAVLIFDELHNPDAQHVRRKLHTLPVRGPAVRG